MLNSNMAENDTTEMLSRPAGKVSWQWWGLWLLVFGVISVFLGRDAGFDIAHYHIHNGWSVLNGRLTTDMAPAELHSFFNPLWQALLWLLIDTLPGPLVVLFLSVLQGLGLPVLYAFTRRILGRLGCHPNPWIVLLISVAGFFASMQFLFMSSLLNDGLFATVFIAALVLLMPTRSELPRVRDLAVASFLVGATVGLKLTNASYAVCFAGTVMILLPSWRARLQGGIVCALSGLAAIVILGGPWAWWLYQEFANPIFPNLNSLFDAPLGPDAAFRDTRYLPSSVMEGILRPFLFLFNTRLIYEDTFTDVRFQLSYVSCAVMLIIALVQRRRMTQPGFRLIVAVSTGVLMSIVFWSVTFSISRYIFAVWVLGPSLTIAALATIYPKGLAHKYARPISLGLVVLLFGFSDTPDARRLAWQSWQEPYVEAHVEDATQFSGTLIAFSGNLPGAFLAPFLPSDAQFTHLVPQDWSAIALENYKDQKVRPAVRNGTKPLYVIIADSGDNFLTTMSRLKTIEGVSVNQGACQRITTSFAVPGVQWEICPASYGPNL